MQPARFLTIAALGLAVSTTPAEARHRSSRTWDLGTVEVQNRAGVPITVTVEAGGTHTLAPFETERFVVPAGRTDVRATYEMYGQRFTLFSESVRVRDRRTTLVQATPVTAGKLRLVNDSGAEASFRVEGREVAELSPGESRLVTVPLGPVDLRVTARGVELEDEHLVVRPFVEATLVAEPPAFAQLVVDNPLPIPVEVDLGHCERRVEAFGRTVFERVPVGTLSVQTRRLGGELLDRERVTVRAWSGAHLVVDTPNTGLVRLESQDDDLLRVFVDGRVVATLAPLQVTNLELPVGNAYLEVRTLDGRLVEREYLYVQPYGVASVDFGHYERGRGHHAHRDDDHERHHESAEVARR